MKFHELEYKRITLEAMRHSYKQWMEQLKGVRDVEEVLRIMEGVAQVQRHQMSMQNLCELRYKQALNNEFYNQEITYWHEVSPLLDELNQEWMRELMKVACFKELKEKLPSMYWQSKEIESKLRNESLIPYLQEENRLVCAYLKLVGQIIVEFDGQSLNLSQLQAYQSDPCVDVREAAWLARASAFEVLEEQIDEIYDQLIQLRTKMAKSLGFDDFTKMGYLRLFRTDYTQRDVETLRKSILEEVTPRVSEMLMSKINGHTFNSLIYEKVGNGEVAMSVTDIIAMGNSLFQKMGAVEFYQKMIKEEYVDLQSRKHKEGGGYCTYLPEWQMPFVYTNFQGTISDFTVFTHEFGHAFQKYLCRDLTFFDCQAPTMDLAEIHSMSMEIFAYDAIEDEKTRKQYQKTHLSQAMEFLPYAALIDAFEHEIYAQPSLSKQSRKEKFRSLEKTYLPHRTYGNCFYFEKGNWWQQQGHIFFMPFYYLDYAIARICSLQFYSKINKQEGNSQHDYVTLCQMGGYESFLNALAKANLTSPFDEGVLKAILVEMNKEMQ